MAKEIWPTKIINGRWPHWGKYGKVEVTSQEISIESKEIIHFCYLSWGYIWLLLYVTQDSLASKKGHERGYRFLQHRRNKEDTKKSESFKARPSFAAPTLPCLTLTLIMSFQLKFTLWRESLTNWLTVQSNPNNLNLRGKNESCVQDVLILGTVHWNCRYSLAVHQSRTFWKLGLVSVSLDRNETHFFAMDQPNYAQWLPVYIADMNILESSHPKVHKEFVAGNFSIRHCRVL